MGRDVVHWLLQSDEPWTRYRARVDLLGESEESADVQTARAAMLSHPLVQGLAARASSWPGYPLKRHNDAKHPLYALATLADFGVRHDDHLNGQGMSEPIEAVLAHQAAEGAFQTRIALYRRFHGRDGELMSWAACDAPTLLYALLAMGLEADSRVPRAVEHLVGLVEANGWRCRADPTLGPKFKGPGRRTDPCPIVNVYALKALAQLPDLLDSPAARRGAEMLLSHWEQRHERKMYLFAMGTDFRKLKYPYVWYDILHVVEVLSRFPFVRGEARFGQMVEAIRQQADHEGRYTAGSMYRAWKDWSFADKKNPSPWLTFLAVRMISRATAKEDSR